MAEFQVPAREGKEDFGTVTVHVPELTFRPEVAVRFQFERGGQEEFLGWGGKLWRTLKGPGRKPVNKAEFPSLLAVKQEADPFGAAEWTNPFEPNRNSFSQDPRRANPFEGKRMSKNAVKAVRMKEVEEAAKKLAIVEDQVFIGVDAPRILVKVNPGKSVHLQVALPDGEGYVEPGQWNAFRADRMGDADAYARSLAEREGLQVLPMSGRLDVIYAEPLINENDVVAPATHALGRFIGFAEKFGGNLPDELSRKAKEAKDFLAGSPTLDTVDQADAAYEMVKETGDLLRGIKPAAEAEMMQEAALWVCDAVALRYATVDRDWLAERASNPVPKF